VTIYEIAKRAGVSSTTVARVLRGDVRESYRKGAETARRVRAIAKEMGYRPNLRARAFSRRRTRSVGLVYNEHLSIFSGVV
jgi:LacI family transcriptional regulator